MSNPFALARQVIIRIHLMPLNNRDGFCIRIFLAIFRQIVILILQQGQIKFEFCPENTHQVFFGKESLSHGRPLCADSPNLILNNLKLPSHKLVIKYRIY